MAVAKLIEITSASGESFEDPARARESALHQA